MNVLPLDAVPGLVMIANFSNGRLGHEGSSSATSPRKRRGLKVFRPDANYSALNFECTPRLIFAKYVALYMVLYVPPDLFTKIQERNLANGGDAEKRQLDEGVGWSVVPKPRETIASRIDTKHIQTKERRIGRRSSSLPLKGHMSVPAGQIDETTVQQEDARGRMIAVGERTPREMSMQFFTSSHVGGMCVFIPLRCAPTYRRLSGFVYQGFEERQIVVYQRTYSSQFDETHDEHAGGRGKENESLSGKRRIISIFKRRIALVSSLQL
ncbi:hypothetical protein BDN71DRAFT_1510234 [Pleurotus eryngii]|uniref:Uncharacterized protein n=1 Tax=Pleurotus eryngii TaxID=5323 RepID=A0A9P6D565_PLEER|nr:hypothetical protein BDN71DRAFT_1510234 [Pleurotus eryngii]